MSIYPSIEQLRQNYKNLPDKKLVELATDDITGLRKEAVEALKEELVARGLDENLDAAIAVQTEEISDADLQAMVSIIRHLPCPYCKQKSKLLNAIEIQKASLSRRLARDRDCRIGCEDCLLKANAKATLYTASFGWLGIPFGLINTPLALIHNAANKKILAAGETSDILIEFVRNKRGAITKAGHDEIALSDLIDRDNFSDSLD